MRRSRVLGLASNSTHWVLPREPSTVMHASSEPGWSPPLFPKPVVRRNNSCGAYRGLSRKSAAGPTNPIEVGLVRRFGQTAKWVIVRGGGGGGGTRCPVVWRPTSPVHHRSSPVIPSSSALRPPTTPGRDRPYRLPSRPWESRMEAVEGEASRNAAKVCQRAKTCPNTPPRR